MACNYCRFTHDILRAKRTLLGDPFQKNWEGNECHVCVCQNFFRTGMPTLHLFLLAFCATLAVFGDGVAVGGQMQQSGGSSDRYDGATVFYNLFVSSPKDSERVLGLVQKQLEMVQPDSHILVNSIGTPLAIPNTISLKHVDKGDEVNTLYDIWNYCQDHRDSDVIYLHSKGSFHNTKENAALRTYITAGATSGECARMRQLGCNFCSSRMSPIPHPHTSGNMWRAQCSYVAKLPNPKTFEGEMKRVQFKGPPWCGGKGRYSVEHWILSHPDAVPCDVDPSPDFLTGYRPIPMPGGPQVLSRAPRFAASYYKEASIKITTKGGLCGDSGLHVQHRLKEYEQLFGPSGKHPKESWWGWNMFRQPHVLPTGA